MANPNDPTGSMEIEELKEALEKKELILEAVKGERDSALAKVRNLELENYRQHLLFEEKDRELRAKLAEAKLLVEEQAEIAREAIEERDRTREEKGLTVKPLLPSEVEDLIQERVSSAIDRERKLKDREILELNMLIDRMRQ